MRVAVLIICASLYLAWNGLNSALADSPKSAMDLEHWQGMVLTGKNVPKPYQLHEAFVAAILDDSSSPYLVLIEVVDDRSGQSEIGCTSANYLKGAIFLEKWGNFDRPSTLETRVRYEELKKIALDNTSHVFHFSTETAISNVLPFRYPEACAAIAQGTRVRVADRTGQLRFGPFVEGPDIIWGSCPIVPYPLEKTLSTEGGCSVSLLIDQHGTVTDSEVTESSGSKVLDDSIRGALAACKFKPRRIDDVPISDAARWTIRIGNRAKWPFTKQRD